MKDQKLKTKAYGINLSKIDEGFVYSEIIVHAESKNNARALLMDKVRYDGMRLRGGEDLRYLNIPVVRVSHYDLKEFEGQLLTELQINETISTRARIELLDKIINDSTVTHCYIKKHGSYYRPNSCGYTQIRVLAGVYLKQEAVSEGKRCAELQIIPVNKDEHNAVINESIEELKSKLICYTSL